MSKYDKFPTQNIKVPVQYGKLSKEPRQCFIIGSVQTKKGLDTYYRICPWEPAGGRLLVQRAERQLDGTFKYSISYTNKQKLPRSIVARIESRRRA